MVDSWNSAVLNEAANNGSIGGGGSDLPEVTSSDNGDVLTVVEGEWNKAAIPSQLPEVESTDEGKVLTVNSSGEWEAENLSSSGVNYSTNEFDTGEKWIDGSPIYCKVFSITDFISLTFSTSGVAQMVASPSGISKIIDADIIGTNGNMYLHFKPFTFIDAPNSVILGGGMDTTLTTEAYLILRYLKTVTPSRKKK